MFHLLFVKDWLMVEMVRTSAGRAAAGPLLGSFWGVREGSTATMTARGSNSLASVALDKCGSQAVIILDLESQNWQDLLDNFVVKCSEGMSLSLFSSKPCCVTLAYGKKCNKHCTLWSNRKLWDVQTSSKDSNNISTHLQGIAILLQNLQRLEVITTHSSCPRQPLQSAHGLALIVSIVVKDPGLPFSFNS